MSAHTFVYVIEGASGEYSDRQNWPVVAFLDKAKADERLEALEKWARDNRLHATNYGDLAEYDDRDSLRKTNPYDPSMQCDYTGTDYYVLSVRLEATP